MRRSCLTLLLLLCMPLMSIAAPDRLVVIANTEQASDTLSKRQLIDLYMGRNQQLPDGGQVIRVDQEPSSDARRQFYDTLVGKTVAQIRAYWARLAFTGRATPPIVVSGDADVKRVVRDNVNAIGYVSEQSVDPSVRILGYVE